MEQQTVRADSLAFALDDMFNKHGVWQMLAAFAKALHRRRQTVVKLREAHLDDRLRRDIGLPAEPRGPTQLNGMRPLSVWDVRW
jgi:hypothetical protein